jgi:hypothetical protein
MGTWAWGQVDHSPPEADPPLAEITRAAFIYHPSSTLQILYFRCQILSLFLFSNSRELENRNKRNFGWVTKKDFMNYSLIRMNKRISVDWAGLLKITAGKEKATEWSVA